jgi:hypothetical protein
MTGIRITDKVYGGKGRKGTHYAPPPLKKNILLPVVVHHRSAPIMNNNIQQRDAEDDFTARSREAKRASEARAKTQESQIAHMHATMLQQQEQMRFQQEEMLCQRSKMATIIASLG